MAAKPKARIVVVGSSFIGMEAASVLVKEASSIVVVGMEKVPFERVLGEAIGTAMQKLHEEKGVSFRMGAVVDVFEPSGALDAPDAACAAPAPQDSSPALRSTGPDTPRPPAPGYARTHPRRNVLQKALGGANQFVEPQVGAVACARGDFFLLCSDGLTEGLYDHYLVDILRAAAKDEKNNPAQLLVNESVKNDGRDNTTALVVQVI